ncbi:MAG: 2-oxoacid:acceptor oxidoreductase subunit alpha [Vampirovibrionales bacterium]
MTTANGKNDLCWMIGGPQGTGVDSSATLFARACSEAAYWVFGKREYHSNIKGAHSYFQVRVKTESILSFTDPVHILATFDNDTAVIHGDEIVTGGALIYDPRITKPETLALKEGVLLFAMPFDAIIQELADELQVPITKLAIVKNTIAVAGSLALMGLGLEPLERALNGLFTGKKAKLAALNFKAGEKAWNFIKNHELCGGFEFVMAPNPNPPAPGSRMILNGSVATGLGKIKAGCRFQTYYSITPAVDECIFLEEHPEFGTVVIQCEDELAAINMANSGAASGIRSSTSTSGPGFSLMAEGIGWAGINEVPTVVFDYQRGGPSTGLPTRHEQGDLLYALNPGHGDFAKIVIAPGDLHECFEDGFQSFNYAEAYQMPVMVLVDKALANSTQSCEVMNQHGWKINRGLIVGADPDVIGDPQKSIQMHKRFELTESGISARALPGTPGRIHWLTGDEHDEYGQVTEKPEIRLPMQEKRQRKLELVLKEVPQANQFKLYGPQEAGMTVVCWGSTKGPILDAMKVLALEGIQFNVLQIRMMSPFPTEAINAILSKGQRLVLVEANHSGQLGTVIRMNTGIDIPHKILKWTGRPISETEMVESLRDVALNGTRKVALTSGR